MPAAGGAPRILTPDLDRNVLSPRFTADGESILFLLEDDQSVHLAKIAAGGGAIERLVGGRRVVVGFSSAPGGHVAVLASDAAHARGDLRRRTAPEPRRCRARTTRWSPRSSSARSRRRSSRARTARRSTASSSSLRTIEAGDGSIPTILRIHGGPVGQFENAFDAEWQWLAANGYVVIAANPRGSSGRGEKFQTAIYADWGHRDVEDVLAAVDDAVARGLADPDRLGVGGWSYGGMLTNYVIASTTRFKAATSGAGSSNALAGYGTDQYIREYEQELGTPWKNFGHWHQACPSRSCTPTGSRRRRSFSAATRTSTSR